MDTWICRSCGTKWSLPRDKYPDMEHENCKSPHWEKRKDDAVAVNPILAVEELAEVNGGRSVVV